MLSSLFTWGELLEWLSIGILGYFFLVNGIYLTLVIISFFYMRKFKKRQLAFEAKGLFRSDIYKSVSIIVPAYNEEEEIIENLNSMLQLEFKDFEIVVVNDGSDDNTLQVIIDHFDMKKSDMIINEVLDSEPVTGIYTSETFTNLILIDKENGRKADAMNAGINVAHKELVCAIDADSRLERDVLKKMLQAFIQDDTTVGVGGIIRVLNGCTIKNNLIEEVRIPRKFIPKIQVVEYLRAFLYGRIGWERLQGLMLISGGFGVFDREAVLRVGGYDTDSLGEDFEMTVKLHRYHIENDIPYRIKFQPEPVCWTNVPDDWDELSKQRNRWHRGLTGTLEKHKEMIFNSKYGISGLLAMPYYYLVEFMGPFIEMFGYIVIVVLMLTGLLNETFALLFFVAAILFGMILSIAALITDEYTYSQYPRIRDLLMLNVFGLVENIGYRQLHTWWRIHGFIDYLRGKKQWGENKGRMLSKKANNVLHWIWLALITGFIAALGWYGIQGVI